LDSHSGSVLCFLPGQVEIRAAQNALEDVLNPSIEVAMLFGGLKDREQMQALSPPKPGTRKVILATDIAETSLTVPNVHAVVDSGFRRIPVFDERLGVTQLKKQRASKDRLDQRRGRAGRVAPGLCIRLWPQEEMRAIRESAAPDVETQDLTDIVLACADWGVSDIAALAWTSPPPARVVIAAQKRLQDLGLLDAEARITPRGRLAARLPMDADLAALLIAASGTPEAHEAALLCAWLSDGGARGQGCIDLEAAVNDLAYQSGRHNRLWQRAQAWLKMVRAAGLPEARTGGESPAAGIQLALTRPHLIAKRRSGGVPGSFKLAAGRGAFVEGNTDLQAAPYLVVGSAILAGEDVRITSAWPFTQQDVDTQLESLFQRKERVVANEKHGRMQIEKTLSIGDIVIRASREDVAPGPKLAQMLFETVRTQGLDAVPLPPEFHALKARADFALRHGSEGLDLTDDVLLEKADMWLMPLLEKAPSLLALPAKALFEAIVQMQDYQMMRALDRFAPTHFAAPADVRLAIDYSASPAPNVAAKLQAFMGLKDHPAIANGRVALLVTLLSPAGRPLQTTQDLPGFWAGSYADVRRDMRGRYPKHPWPEDPANAMPTLKTKNWMKR
jgi:ATP-dependent helicase HrpB